MPLINILRVRHCSDFDRVGLDRLHHDVLILFPFDGMPLLLLLIVVSISYTLDIGQLVSVPR